MFDMYFPRGVRSKSNYPFLSGSLAATVLAMGILASKAASAETLVEQVVDTRLVLAFRVDPAVLQKLVPGPWIAPTRLQARPRARTSTSFSMTGCFSRIALGHRWGRLIGSSCSHQ